jgi:PAS domain S-box-containing protein
MVGDAASSNNASQEAAFAERMAQRLPGLFVALDEGGRVVVWNQQCERLTGWTLAEVRADAGRLFPDAQYRNRIAAEWEKRSKLPLYHDWEWRVACKDGSHRTFSWTSCHVFSSLSPWYFHSAAFIKSDEDARFYLIDK